MVSYSTVDGNFEKVLYNRTYDICGIIDMKTGTKFIQQISKRFLDSLNIPLHCPIQPKLYEFRFTLNNITVPLNIPLPKFLIKSELNLYTQNFSKLEYVSFFHIQNLLINKKLKST